jgi:hypothetical protein
MAAMVDTLAQVVVAVQVVVLAERAVKAVMVVLEETRQARVDQAAMAAMVATVATVLVRVATIRRPVVVKAEMAAVVVPQAGRQDRGAATDRQPFANLEHGKTECFVAALLRQP